MASTSEVGNAKNVANFFDLITFAEGYGTTYAPSKTALKLPALTALHTQADAELNTVATQVTAYNTAVNARVVAFTGLRALATRIVNALEATDASKETIADAKGFNAKIRGERASKKDETIDPNNPPPKTISSSQQSYDQLIQHFSGLLDILTSESSYEPNEADLKIAALKAKLTDLKAKNNQLATAYTTVSNARIARDKVLYKPEIGVVEIAAEVKKYIKSVYGASSAEFKQVSGIKFTNKRA